MRRYIFAVATLVVLDVFMCAGLASGATPATTLPISMPTSQAATTQPTTSPAGGPSIAEIRALVTGAIAMKRDPKRAQAMLVRACELTSKLPPGSDIKGLFVYFTPDKGELDHLLTPISAEVLEEKKKLSTHIQLCEKYLSSTYPFVGMADNRKAFIFPRPMTDKVLKEQDLQRDGNSIFVIISNPSKETRWKDYYVSPDEAFVVLQDWLRAKPTEVLSIGTGKTVHVEAPEIEGHNNVYPFRFVKWADDSRSFTVEVSGTYVKGPGEFLAYRELWQVQADTGKAKQIKRQEQPWQEKLKWED